MFKLFGVLLLAHATRFNRARHFVKALCHEADFILYMNFDTREMTSDKPVALAQLNARIKLFRKCMTPRAPVVTAPVH